jgi:hypothetical protein
MCKVWSRRAVSVTGEVATHHSNLLIINLLLLVIVANERHRVSIRSFAQTHVHTCIHVRMKNWCHVWEITTSVHNPKP